MSCALIALEQRLEADLALGRHAEAVPELEALVREYPLRESLRGLLMRALYRSGRQADALAVMQDTRATLRDELGLDPSQALQQLEKAILIQDPSLDRLRCLRRGTSTAAVQPPAPPPLPPLPAALTPLVGRTTSSLNTASCWTVRDPARHAASGLAESARHAWRLRSPSPCPPRSSSHSRPFRSPGSSAR